MLSLLALLTLAQTNPAVRRTTPAADDPGMVVRSVGTTTVTCTNCAGGGGSSGWVPDGGAIGSVSQGPGQDGGSWAVYVVNSVSSTGSWVPDGGSIGFMQMPDAGPLEVGGSLTVVQATGSNLHVAVDSMPSTAVTGPLTDAQLRALAVPVSAAALPLPSGASTSALQSTGNASLSSLDGKAPVLGQSVMTGSMPVVIASNQSAVPVSGTVTANAGTGTMTVGQATGTNLHVVVDSAPSTAVTGPLTDAELRAVPVPVSGAVTATVSQATGTNLHVVVDSAPSTAVTGPLTDAQLRAVAVPVSGTITANAGSGTMAVSAASLPLPSGASTAAKQPALGTAGSASADVLTVQGVASMTALKVDGSAVTQPVSGTVTANAGTGSFTVAQATAANLQAQTSSESATASAVPTNASAAGFSDGTNLRIPRVVDVDTSGTTNYAAASAIVSPTFGGTADIVQAQTDDSGNVGLRVAPHWKRSSVALASAVTCATTATAAPTAVLSRRVTLTLMNNSSVTIYLGHSAVTTSTGMPLAPGASFSDNVQSTPYYCIVASGTAELRVLEN